MLFYKYLVLLKVLSHQLENKFPNKWEIILCPCLQKCILSAVCGYNLGKIQLSLQCKIIVYIGFCSLLEKQKMRNIFANKWYYFLFIKELIFYLMRENIVCTYILCMHIAYNVEKVSEASTYIVHFRIIDIFKVVKWAVVWRGFKKWICNAT